MAIENLQTTQTINLGRQGENKALTLTFNCMELSNTYGAGTPVLVHQRNGDSRPYIVDTTYAGFTLTWVIKSGDTAKAGTGYAEIRWYVTGDKCAKSAVFNTKVVASLMDDTAEQPGSIVYMTSVASGINERLTGVEGLSSTKINEMNNSDYRLPDEESDAYTFTYAGKAGYDYTFKATRIDTYGGASASLTMRLLNSGNVRGSVNIYSKDTEYTATATGDFTQIMVMPHVDMTGITFTVHETSPIVKKIKQLEAALENMIR